MKNEDFFILVSTIALFGGRHDSRIYNLAFFGGGRTIPSKESVKLVKGFLNHTRFGPLFPKELDGFVIQHRVAHGEP